jgi:hypothetical protein
MPRKAASGGRELSSGIQPREAETEWLNIQLDETDIAIIIEGADNIPALGDALALLLIQGGDITIKYDSEKSEYLALVFSSIRPDTGNRFGVSARAKTGLLAAAAVFYKVSLYKTSPDRFAKSGQNMGIR